MEAFAWFIAIWVDGFAAVYLLSVFGVWGAIAVAILADKKNPTWAQLLAALLVSICPVVNTVFAIVLLVSAEIWSQPMRRRQ